MTQDITQISDEMLRELWLSEQLPFDAYRDERLRRISAKPIGSAYNEFLSGALDRLAEPQSIGALAEKVVNDAQAKFTVDELNALYDGKVPVLIMKLLFSDKSRDLTIGALRHIARAVAYYDAR